MSCPVSEKDFLAHAKELSLTVDGEIVPLEPRTFSTGSFGWGSYGTLSKVPVRGYKVHVNMTMSAVVRGSKHAPAESLPRESWLARWGLICWRRRNATKTPLVIKKIGKKTIPVQPTSKLKGRMSLAIAKTLKTKHNKDKSVYVVSPQKHEAKVVMQKNWGWLSCLRRRPSIESFFFPDKDGMGVSQIISLLDNCTQELCLAMFCFTDDRLADVVYRCHTRGVKVRLIVDDLQAECLGADPKRLALAGLKVRHDGNISHMHHKFAVVDGTTVLTGSFNWTVRASTANREHIVIIRNRTMAQDFRKEFETLWHEFEGNDF